MMKAIAGGAGARIMPAGLRRPLRRRQDAVDQLRAPPAETLRGSGDRVRSDGIAALDHGAATHATPSRNSSSSTA